MSNTLAPEAFVVSLDDIFNVIGSGYYKVMSDESPFFAYRQHDEDVWLVKTQENTVERFTSAGLQHAAIFPYPIDDLYILLNQSDEPPVTMRAQYQASVLCGGCYHAMAGGPKNTVYCYNDTCDEYHVPYHRPKVILTRADEGFERPKVTPVVTPSLTE